MSARRTSNKPAPFLARRLAEVRAQAAKPGYDPALEGVRGIAVGLVFLVHVGRIVGPLWPNDPTLQFALASVSVAGHAGVHLFFALSGFLIYGLVMERRPSYRRFLWRRLQRIYPAFPAVAGLYLAASFAVPSVSKLPAGASRGKAIPPLAVSALELRPSRG